MTIDNPRRPDSRLTIIVHLPASFAGVMALLAVVAEQWPDARIDTTHADGWRVEVMP